ncbi:MAG: cupin domain-containing protein [Nitrospiraceae bacterium]|nr:cupin domain-containing protein [Nitrospiraceae bacterium]
MQGYQMPLAIALAVGIAATAYAQETPQVLKLPDQIEWKAPPMVGGASTAILYGDPTKPSVYVTRTKFPAGLKGLPHTHPDEWRTVVVLSGTIYFGLGDTWDEGKLKPYPTGTFFSEPKDTPHFVWAKDGEVVVQVTAMGPTGTKMIPPK